MLPALNEEATVAEVIAAVPRQIDGIAEVQALVIDDGSTDATAERARDAGAVVVRHRRNRGLGATFVTGLNAALDLGADLIVNIDADGQFDPAGIPALIEPILAGRAEMTTASRFADPEMIPEMPRLKIWGNRRFARLVSRLTGVKMHDVSCGFRAYSREAALRATLLGGHTYTHEVILDLAFRGFAIEEVPTRVHGVRKHGPSRVAGSLWRYGTRSLAIIFRAYRDYKPMAVFGSIAAVFILLAALLGGFLAIHYAATGAFSPYRFVGFMAGGFGLIALLSLVTALLAGMINRLRVQQDELLYLMRRRQYDTPLSGRAERKGP